MSNTSSGAASKGSKSYLQQYMVNSKDKLSEAIIAASPSLLSFIESKNKIDWKSPLAIPEKQGKEEFYEYRDDFLEVLGLNDDIHKEKLVNFWPKNGPQWDGLAVVNGKNGQKGLLLVEAKAHISEIRADLKATSETSIKRIKDSMKAAQNYYGIGAVDWTKHYYQLGNRIAFLYFMNEILHIPTWLVLINFTDGDYKSTSLEQWLAHYHKIYTDIGIKQSNYKLLSNIIQIFPNAL